MDENVQKLRVGIYTVIVILILGILIFLMSEGWNSTYNIFLKPNSAPGVRVGTPVRKNGILIGRVADVKTEDDHVVLRLAIRESEHVYENETISIGAESVLGDAGLEVLPLAKQTRGQLVSDNSELRRYEVKPNPMELISAALELEDDISSTLGSIRETSATIGKAGEGIDTLTSQVNAILTDDDSDIKKMIADIRQLSMKAEAALDNVDIFFEQIVATMEDPDVRSNFNELIKEIPSIFKEVRIAISDGRKVIGEFGGIGTKVNDNLDNITSFTESLGTTGPEVVEQINGGVKDIRALIAQAEGLGDTLEKLQETFGNQNGTVGKLFNDSEVYDEALKTIRNIKEVSDEVKRVSAKLEPLMNDARHLVDKVARDPGGVIRGALQNKPIGAGYKGTPGSRGFFQ